ncbi:MAG: hypothetical protein EOP60_01875 [Sphingomonadales bacterium]|nr:MAG: hypothetical protein EOP60_01875 [Sphingomonadales bacterium]
MQYQVHPFEPNAAGGDTAQIANSLEKLIEAQTALGWEFVAVENHSTVVPGSEGCFGIGATTSYPKTFSVVVFRK